MAPRHRLFPFAKTSCAVAALAAVCNVWAQTPPTTEPKPASAELTPQKVTVTGQMIAAPLKVGGFADEALAKTPVAASVLTENRLRDTGAKTISDLTRLDAAVSDAYDAEGYWNAIAVRGFVVDGRFNYRRDGLPINGETTIHLGNKSSLEVLKGVSGMQAGTSAPGGLLNFVVKRPTNRLRGAMLEARDSGSVGISADIAERFGTDDAVGLRVNVAHDTLKPAVRDARGTRRLASVAADWRATPDTLLEAEVESSRQSQPSVPGFSLLGNRVPDAAAVDPRINLNNQAWTTPVVLAGTTASLRVQQNLTRQWRATVHGMTQRLKNDDRVAFPYGCSSELVFDRFCSDGSVDIYDFRSDNERRRSDALDVSVSGPMMLGTTQHAITVGMLATRFTSRFNAQAFNFAGVGNIDGSVAVPAAPDLTDENTNRRERSTELYARNAITLAPAWRVWMGLRHSQLNRASVRTDGSRATSYQQSFTTPWLALTHQATPQTMLYASVGQGIESDVAPNRSRYTNAGQALPALKSQQVEIGVKHDGDTLDASAAVFDIRRPQATDIGPCDVAGSCTRQIDGTARHRGAEALVSWRLGDLTLHASGMLLDAKRQGAADASANGLRPTNAPRYTARLHSSYNVPALPGLALMASVVHESDRMALPDNSASIPAWTRLDLVARWRQALSDNTQLTWRLGLDNATNTRAWQEAPYQFGHAYLFPTAPRTVRLSLHVAF